MTKRNNKSNSDYKIIGYVFLAIAFGMFLSETTRGLSVAFFAIGIAFVVIEMDQSGGKKKSDKKKSD